MSESLSDFAKGMAEHYERLVRDHSGITMQCGCELSPQTSAVRDRYERLAQQWRSRQIAEGMK